MKTGTIIVVEDERPQRETLAHALRQSGHRVLEAKDAAQAVSLAQNDPVDVVITDLRMPGGSGLDLLQRIKEIQPEIAVVPATAYATVANAVAAMKGGAADYLTKPVDLDELDLVVARVLAGQDLVRENRVLRRRLEEVAVDSVLIGHSASLREVLAKAARAAETDATVLIPGESGTGKELLARSIHKLGRRAEKPFVAVNCAALPETLLESELFGHEKGAFTGAHARHVGRVERAEGGTLFLDEIGDISLQVQVKLLRFLEAREFARLGGEKNLRADVRVIAATHQDLDAQIRNGKLREDLFYRLNVVNLTLPPLRERREDIPELVEHFLVRFAKRYERPIRALTHEAMDALIKHSFPGNVRELENVIEQAIVLAPGQQVAVDDLPERVLPARAGPSVAEEDAWTPELEAVRETCRGSLRVWSAASFWGRLPRTRAIRAALLAT
ncbi:MAG: sigma-54 dependent transcriptional regulator [Acidobacteriota bacterium]